MKKPITLALAVLALAAIAAAPASANHAWGSYHWARIANPFTVDLGNNLTGAWATGGYLSTVSTDWSLSDVLDTRIVAGARKHRCGDAKAQRANKLLHVQDNSSSSVFH